MWFLFRSNRVSRAAGNLQLHETAYSQGVRLPARLPAYSPTRVPMALTQPTHSATQLLSAFFLLCDATRTCLLLMLFASAEGLGWLLVLLSPLWKRKPPLS